MLSIVYSTVVATAIGLGVGLAGRWPRNRIDDPPIEIAGSILLAYAAYLPAEALHASGVLRPCATSSMTWILRRTGSNPADQRTAEIPQTIG